MSGGVVVVWGRCLVGDWGWRGGWKEGGRGGGVAFWARPDRCSSLCSAGRARRFARRIGCLRVYRVQRGFCWGAVVGGGRGGGGVALVSGFCCPGSQASPAPRDDGGCPSGASAVVIPRRCGSRPRRTRRGRRSRRRATPGRRARACTTRKPASASTPMPIFTGHGHGAGVTNPSMIPDTKRKKHQPDRDAEQRPGVLGEGDAARPRPRRDPGPEDAQARRRGHEHARELEQPVRGDVEEEGVGLVVGEHDRGRDAEVLRVLQDHPGHPHAEDAEGHALRGDPRVVRPHRARERRRRVLGVVRDEALVGELPQLGLGADRREHARIAADPPGVSAATTNVTTATARVSHRSR